VRAVAEPRDVCLHFTAGDLDIQVGEYLDGITLTRHVTPAT
jgi:hypothetical protein